MSRFMMVLGLMVSAWTLSACSSTCSKERTTASVDGEEVLHKDSFYKRTK